MVSRVKLIPVRAWPASSCNSRAMRLRSNSWEWNSLAVNPLSSSRCRWIVWTKLAFSIAPPRKFPREPNRWKSWPLVISLPDGTSNARNPEAFSLAVIKKQVSSADRFLFRFFNTALKGGNMGSGVRTRSFWSNDFIRDLSWSWIWLIFPVTFAGSPCRHLRTKAAFSWLIK